MDLHTKQDCFQELDKPCKDDSPEKQKLRTIYHQQTSESLLLWEVSSKRDGESY